MTIILLLPNSRPSKTSSPHLSRYDCDHDHDHHHHHHRLRFRQRRRRRRRIMQTWVVCVVLWVMGGVLLVVAQQQQQQQQQGEIEDNSNHFKEDKDTSLVPEYINHHRNGMFQSWKRSIAKMTRSLLVPIKNNKADEDVNERGHYHSAVGQALHLNLSPQQHSKSNHNDDDKTIHSVSKLVAQNLNQRHAFLAQTSEAGRRIHHRMAHAAYWNDHDGDNHDDDIDIDDMDMDNDSGAKDTDPYGLLVKNNNRDTPQEHSSQQQQQDNEKYLDFQYFHGKEYQDRASREFRHSFAGMKLHVFQNNNYDHDDQKMTERRNTDSDDPLKKQHLPLVNQQHPQKQQLGDEGDDFPHHHFVFDTAYELMEPMHLELGIAPKHYSDYAYTPVYYYSHHQGYDHGENSHPYHHHLLGRGGQDASPTAPRARLSSSRLSQQRVRPISTTHQQQQQEEAPLTETSFIGSIPPPATTTVIPEQEEATCLALVEGGTELEKESCKAIEEKDSQHGADNQDTWWKWWFSFTDPWWRNGDNSKQSEYTMGRTAFAGGSHGQVWRGRRVCHNHHHYRHGKMREESGFRFKDHSDDCDEDKPLILKRLKVEQGYRLLEAGLREIHFGQWIQGLSEESEKDLFTTYVDHFFRELPSAFGSSTGSTDLELWIVFEDAGPSLRNYMYAPVSSGGFVMYQHSPLWTQLRMTSRDFQHPSGHYDGHDVEEDSIEILYSHDKSDKTGRSNKTESQPGDRFSDGIPNIGRQILRSVLQQILSAAAVLHENGIVHRDIKPSNVMCLSDIPLDDLYAMERLPHIHCRLGDFSSGWDQYSDENLYTKGPSPGEQTDEYAPPEAYIDPHWVPFDKRRPQSYDSWSIGVLALELLLGTPNVFSVDQRTTVLLTSKMKKEGATDEELQRALYLAALSQFCIYVPNSTNKQHQASWPYRHGDPLHKTAMVKDSCTLQDFHRALRARDPLGMGFDASTDLLLHLIWQLVAWDPMERITAAEALQHPFFLSPDGTRESLDPIPGRHNALESQMLDPRLDFIVADSVQEFICPKCGRAFSDWRSCIRHATTRRHAKFCTYDRRNLPTCINTHSMLPAHPTSGYCDLQGRRLTIEDFHSIHLYHEIQFYGMFDGHTGNFASKYAASTLFDRLVRHLPGLPEVAREKGSAWKAEIERNVSQAFQETHEGFLKALELAPTMDQSGTTATALLVTDDVIVLSSLGDSRAVLSSTDQDGSLSAIQLTNDHVASNPRERALVLERGGSVFSSPGGLDRVNGTLAITRSIGDAALAPMLSRTPDVTSMKRDDIQDLCGEMRHDLPCFVVLASDGLWDVMSNQEAVDMVAEVVAAYDSTDRVSWNNGGAFQEAAEVLAVDAFVRGSTDNIGVCIVALVA